MGVDGRARDGLHPLDLARRAHVQLLDGVVHEADGDDDHDEDGHGGHHRDHGPHHARPRVQQRPHVHGDLHVHIVNVLGEPAEDAAQGRGLEEGHGRPHDAHEHGAVQLVGGVQGNDGHGEGARHHEQGLQQAQGAVHRQVLVPGGLLRAGQGVV